MSNDNPYSEARFKTLKYCPAFSGTFGSIEDAGVFCDRFFQYCNNEHRHSGIGMHTPASVHDGSVVKIHAQRVATLNAAFLAHPERFRGRPPCPPPPTRVTTWNTDCGTDNSPRTCTLAWFHDGGMVTGFRPEVAERDLAAIRTDYAAHLTGVQGKASSGAMPPGKQMRLHLAERSISSYAAVDR